MSVIYVLLPLAVLAATAWTVVFLWSVRDGQFEDLTGDAWRMLGDDVPGPPSAAAGTARAPDAQAARSRTTSTGH